jgi:uroporphyrinogen decarboxylase
MQTGDNVGRTVGKNGELLISPTYTIEPEVPWENIIAFFKAVEEFGSY